MDTLTPQLHACWFPGEDTRETSQMARSARVLAHSARTHCQDWHVQVDQLNAARIATPHGSHSEIANTHKLYDWSARVQAAADGTPVLLIDADTFLTRSLEEIWQQPFDLAYTVREGHARPFNSGVVFLRVSPAVRTFMERWARVNAAMLQDRAFHRPWKTKYGGINQAAFGMLLETEYQQPHTKGLVITTLSCQEWNCEESAWDNFDERTRIVHVKSRLRRAVFDSRVRSGLTDLVERWRTIERAATTPGTLASHRAERDNGLAAFRQITDAL